MLKRLPLLILALTPLALFLVLNSRYRIDDTIGHFVDNLTTQISPTYSNNNPSCTYANYAFPKEALESDTPLPEKVKESFKSTIGITVRFVFSGLSNHLRTREALVSGGSGFVTKQGIILSARHIFLKSMIENQDRYPIIINNDGLPISAYYTYEFCGTASINGKPVNFPLKLIGMGDPYKPQDFAAFAAMNLPPQIKPLEFEENVKLEKIDGRLDEDEVYYSSGRVPSFNPYDNDLNPINNRVLMDFINYNFTGTISAILSDMPNNKSGGLEKIYRINRLRNNTEPGFSGGPVFNNNGKVIGMTVFISPGYNFSLAISAKDLQLFMQKLRREGHIK